MATRTSSTTRRASAGKTAKAKTIKKPAPESINDQTEMQKQAKQIMEMAERSGLQENYFFKTTFDRYLTQLEILAKLKITIDSSEALVEKEYVKGRACVVVNPAITEFNRTTDSANKTVQTLIKILKGFKSSDAGKEQDALLAIINGGDDDEE